MLTITVRDPELFDDEKQEFILGKAYEVELEHSLASLSKWESIWEKPFLTDDKKTEEESLSYIECMIISPNPPPDFLQKLTQETVSEISAYVERKQTATWFSDNPTKTPRSQTITSELIYYWMNSCQIDIEAQYWNLNRLITLIRIHSSQNEPPKKKSQSQIAEERRRLNAKRLAEMGTTG